VKALTNTFINVFYLQKAYECIVAEICAGHYKNAFCDVTSGFDVVRKIVLKS